MSEGLRGKAIAGWPSVRPFDSFPTRARHRTSDVSSVFFQRRRPFLRARCSRRIKRDRRFSVEGTSLEGGRSSGGETTYPGHSPTEPLAHRILTSFSRSVVPLNNAYLEIIAEQLCHVDFDSLRFDVFARNRNVP